YGPSRTVDARIAEGLRARSLRPEQARPSAPGLCRSGRQRGGRPRPGGAGHAVPAHDPRPAPARRIAGSGCSGGVATAEIAAGVVAEIIARIRIVAAVGRLEQTRGLRVAAL